MPPKLKKLSGADLKTCGNTIGIFDMMIAAHAGSRDMVLVINNERHLQRVPNLRIKNRAG